MPGESLPNALLEDLSAQLERLRTEPGDRNTLTVTAGAAWMTFRGSAEGLRCIAASQRDLGQPGGAGLRSASQLRQAGFTLPPRGGRLQRVWGPVWDSGSVALELSQLFCESYGVEASEIELSLWTGDGPVLDNEPLHEAIRLLAKKRDLPRRQAVYRQVFRSRLILAPESDGVPQAIEHLGRFPVYSVFTSLEALERWDPRLQAEVVEGAPQLILTLLKHNAGSMKINPGGLLGGELYRTELESLARAVRRKS